MKVYLALLVISALITYVATPVMRHVAIRVGAVTAVRARGTTELQTAAVEPEILDLISLLQKMGALITVGGLALLGTEFKVAKKASDKANTLARNALAAAKDLRKRRKEQTA